MQMFEKNKTNGSKELEKKITLLGHFRGYL